MEIAEYNRIVYDVNDEIDSIIHHQRVLAGLYQKINTALLRPMEQDYIYKDHYGKFPIEPQEHVIDGITFTSRILHQTGKRLSDIAGADFLYEIENVKYALIQHKRASTQYRISNDKEQFEQLLNNCPPVCMYKKSPPTISPVRLNGFCGCWYRVGYEDKEHYIHACEAKFLHGNTKTTNVSKFKHGISKAEFDKMFASCTIGALTKIHNSHMYVASLLEQSHIVFEVVQKGVWRQEQ